MKETPTPPPCTPETDGTTDAELLEAISRHPDAAHALAAIASGADPAEALSDLLPQKPEDSENKTEAPGIPVSSDEFLSSVRPDFWDEQFSL